MINPATSSGLPSRDRKSTRLNSSHTVIYTLSLHDALPIYVLPAVDGDVGAVDECGFLRAQINDQSGDFFRLAEPRSEEHTSELQSHSDLHSFPTRRSSDLCAARR